MQSCLPTFVRWCTLLGVFLVFRTTCAQAVAANQRLDKTALYPDALGGLSNYTDLTNVMPGQGFTLTRLSQGAEQNCYAPGGTDECANVKSAWSVYNATYSDNPSKGVYVCICQGSPVTAQSLASNYSQVSFIVTLLLPLKRTTCLNATRPVPCDSALCLFSMAQIAASSTLLPQSLLTAHAC